MASSLFQVVLPQAAVDCVKRKLFFKSPFKPTECLKVAHIHLSTVQHSTSVPVFFSVLNVASVCKYNEVDRGGNTENHSGSGNL